MAVKTRSRLTNVLARAGITLAAAGVFLVIRPDVALRAQHEYRRNIQTPQLVDEYLRNHSVRKLQIGAGSNNLPGWLNTDIQIGQNQAYLDATERFPFSDGSIHYIFHEQVIEHITYEQGVAMVQECRRVLAPGGKLRIATPNLVKFMDLFREKKTEEMQHFIKRKLAWHQWPSTADVECYLLNRQLRDWGHQFVYTPKMLRATLESAGFRDIKEFKHGESDDPVLSGVELRSKWEYKDVDAYETMVMQAIRP